MKNASHFFSMSYCSMFQFDDFRRAQRIRTPIYVVILMKYTEKNLGAHYFCVSAVIQTSPAPDDPATSVRFKRVSSLSAICSRFTRIIVPLALTMRSVYFWLAVLFLLLNLAMSAPTDDGQLSQQKVLRRCRYYPYDDCENMTVRRESVFKYPFLDSSSLIKILSESLLLGFEPLAIGYVPYSAADVDDYVYILFLDTFLSFKLPLYSCCN